MVGSETWCRYGTRYARCADDSSRLDELAQHQRKRGKTGDFRGCITAIRSSQLTTFQCRARLKARDLQVTGRRDRERDALHVIRVCASVLSELWSNLGDRQRLLLYYTKRKKKESKNKQNGQEARYCPFLAPALFLMICETASSSRSAALKTSNLSGKKAKGCGRNRWDKHAAAHTRGWKAPSRWQSRILQTKELLTYGWVTGLMFCMLLVSNEKTFSAAAIKPKCYKIGKLSVACWALVSAAPAYFREPFTSHWTKCLIVDDCACCWFHWAHARNHGHSQRRNSATAWGGQKNCWNKLYSIHCSM